MPTPLPATEPAPQPRARINGLDGLRALAVVGVLLYHGEVHWVRGGFIGVDIFFVLSGFLVTSIVIDGFNKRGNLGFRRFWTARLRRLAPAQLALIVVVTTVAAVFYREELADLRPQAFAALFGVTNWYHIVFSGSYFAHLGRPPVLLHLWSLAVELQFYLVFPPLLVLMLKVWPDRLGRIVGVVAGAIVVSNVYQALLFHPGTDPTRPYFDTFARIGTPLVGALLALVWRPRTLGRGPARSLGPASSAAGGVSLLVLLWLMHSVTDQSKFLYQRGGFLLVALLSAVVVAGLVHPAGLLGSERGLGHPALVAVGLRSYALYLWHWPIFMLLRPRVDVGWPWGVVFVVRMALAFGAAELSYRYVERPWHERSPDASLQGLKRRLFQPTGVPTGPRLAALATVFLVATTTVVLVLPHRKTNSIEDSLRAGEAALAAATTTAPTTTIPLDATTIPGQTTTTIPHAPTVTLVGDSVMVGASPDVLDAFAGRANIDAKVARQAASLGPIVRQLGIEGRLGERVVVQVGINGTVTEEDLRSIFDAADGRPVYVIDARVPRQWEQSNNELVERLVPKLPKGHVIGWYDASNGHRDWFLGDGVHLTPEGRRAYAELIRRAVDKKLASKP